MLRKFLDLGPRVHKGLFLVFCLVVKEAKTRLHDMFRPVPIKEKIERFYMA